MLHALRELAVRKRLWVHRERKTLAGMVNHQKRGGDQKSHHWIRQFPSKCSLLLPELSQGFLSLRAGLASSSTRSMRTELLQLAEAIRLSPLAFAFPTSCLSLFFGFSCSPVQRLGRFRAHQSRHHVPLFLMDLRAILCSFLSL